MEVRSIELVIISLGIRRCPRIGAISSISLLVAPLYLGASVLPFFVTYVIDGDVTNTDAAAAGDAESSNHPCRY